MRNRGWPEGGCNWRECPSGSHRPLDAERLFLAIFFYLYFLLIRALLILQLENLPSFYKAMIFSYSNSFLL